MEKTVQKIKINILRIFFVLIYYSGIEYVYLVFFSKEPFKVVIYHSVNNEQIVPPEIGINISVRKFERQMKYFKRRYNVISVEALLEYFNKGRELPHNALVITFDDGYRDNYENAYPILKRFKFPATIYLTTSYIDTERCLPLSSLYYAFYYTNKSKVKLKLESCNKGGTQAKDFNFAIDNEKNKNDALYSIRSFLKENTRKLRERNLCKVKKELNVNDSSNPFRMLLTGQIQEMYNNSISFGSHTKDHPILSGENLEEVSSELVESKKVIECLLGEEIFTFAYPDGGKDTYNEEVKLMVREAGYRIAFTAFNDGKLNCDPYELRRYGCMPDKPIYEFACYFSGIHELIDRIRERYITWKR